MVKIYSPEEVYVNLTAYIFKYRLVREYVAEQFNFELTGKFILVPTACYKINDSGQVLLFLPVAACMYGNCGVHSILIFLYQAPKARIYFVFEL